MKFLHTSDIHYGAAPDANCPWGKERAKAVKEAFNQIIEACMYEKVDFLIVSGGLFDGHPTIEEIEEINAAFEKIPETRIYVIGGEKDPVFSSSPVITFRWAENVTYNTETSFVSTYYDDMKLEIVGASNDKNYFDISGINDVRPEKNEASILVLSSSDVEEEKISDDFTYIALGGSHKPYVLRGGRLVNSGSPEPLGKEDTGKHGYYIGEIDCINRRITALKFVSFSDVKYITLTVNITPASTQEDVLRNLRREMTDRGNRNIYQIKLNGLCNPEEDYNLDELKYEFRISEIKDYTRPDYNYTRLFREHPSDMIGFFVKEMNREDISELDRKAMNYGINALLKTADERD